MCVPSPRSSSLPPRPPHTPPPLPPQATHLVRLTAGPSLFLTLPHSSSLFLTLPLPPLPPPQATRLGFRRLEDVPCSSMGNERAVCDQCTASLPNLHVSCAACGWDVCVRCLRKRRTEAAGGGGAAATAVPPPLLGPDGIWCPNPACKCSSEQASGGGQPERGRPSSSGWPVTASRYLELARLRVLRSKLSTTAAAAAAAVAPPEPMKIVSRWVTALKADAAAHEQGSGTPGDAPPPGVAAGLSERLGQPSLILTAGGKPPSAAEQAAAAAVAGGLGVAARGELLWVWGHWVRASDVRLGTWHAGGGGAAGGGPAAAPSPPGTGRAAAGPAVVPPGMSGAELLIFCPHRDSLEPGHADFAEYLAIFMERWQAREPVVVRGVKGKMRWDPEV